jgi:hypothetical protein
MDERSREWADLLLHTLRTVAEGIPVEVGYVLLQRL